MSDVDEWVAKYLTYVDKLVSMIPYSRAKIWREFFLSPVSVIKKDNAGIGQRLKDLYVLEAVSILVALVMTLPLVAIMAVSSAGVGLMMGGLLLGAMVFFGLLSPIGVFLYSLLELLVAKLLGGKGDMRANFNASALPGLSAAMVQLPITIIMIPLVWLSMVPIVSLCSSCVQLPISLVSLFLTLYMYYLKYLGFKEVHKLSSWRAAGVVVLPIVLIVVIVVALVVLMYAALIAWLMSITAATTAGAGSTLP